MKIMIVNMAPVREQQALQCMLRNDLENKIGL